MISVLIPFLVISVLILSHVIYVLIPAFKTNLKQIENLLEQGGTGSFLYLCLAMFGASAAATTAVMAPTDPRKIFSIKYSYSGEKTERRRRCCRKPY
jgi:hypothetical protein